jgi:hypothetical protein
VPLGKETRMKKPATYWRDSSCAKLLMDEYGVPKDKLYEVIGLIAAIYDHLRMYHSIIILSIRGFTPVPETQALENFLELHRTHPPRHKKGSVEREPEFKGKYIERSYDD